MSLESLKTEHVGHLLSFENLEIEATFVPSVLWSCAPTNVHDGNSEDDLVQVNIFERRRRGPRRRRQVPIIHEESDVLRSLGVLNFNEHENRLKLGTYRRKDWGMSVKSQGSHPYIGYSPPPSPSNSTMRPDEPRISPPSPRKLIGWYHSLTPPRSPRHGDICRSPPSLSSAYSHEYTPSTQRIHSSIAV